MKKQQSKNKKGILFWLPRLITIIFILFISMFALDIFGMNLGFWGTIFGLFMHLTPSIILTAIVIIFWRKSLVLAGMWAAFGIGYIAIMTPNMIRQFEFYYLAWLIQFSGAAFVLTYLFFLDRFKKR